MFFVVFSFSNSLQVQIHSYFDEIIYEMNHILTADMKSSRLRSSQLWTPFLSLCREAWMFRYSPDFFRFLYAIAQIASITARIIYSLFVILIFMAFFSHRESSIFAFLSSVLHVLCAFQDILQEQNLKLHLHQKFMQH